MGSYALPILSNIIDKGIIKNKKNYLKKKTAKPLYMHIIQVYYPKFSYLITNRYKINNF